MARKRNRKRKAARIQNPVQVAMMRRHASTTTTMRDRRARRAKDARNHWSNDEGE